VGALRRARAGWLAFGAALVLAWPALAGAGGGAPGAARAPGCAAPAPSAYVQAVLTDHPAAYYRLDQGSDGGVLCDASGHGDDGKYAASGLVWGVPGAIADGDTAMSAGGQADPASAPAPAGLTGDHDLTLEGWYRSTSAQDQVVVDVGQAGYHQILGLGVWNADDLAADCYNDAKTVSAAPAGLHLRDGRWHFLAVAYTSADRTLHFYADGRALGAAALAAPLELGAGQLRVGWWVDTFLNQPFRGALDEVAVYPAALGAGQIRAQFAAADVPGADQSSIAAALVPPAQALGSVGHDAAVLAVAAGGTLFLTFPSQLFNSTFQENYEEIRDAVERRLRRLRGLPGVRGLVEALRRAAARASQRGREWPGLVAVILGGALLGSLLDPRFGFNGTSIESYVALVASIVFGLAVSGTVAFHYRRRRGRAHQYTYHAIPAGLVVAALCVLVSRLAGFEPGYLYGVICGLVFSEELVAHEAAHVIVLSALAALCAALACWALWSVVNPLATNAGADFPLVILDDFLGAAVAGGLTGTVIGLLPLRFLPGGRLIAWHRGAWSGTFLLSAFGLLGIVVWPHRLGHRSGAPLATTLTLFLLFGGASVAFWWYFEQRRRRRAAAADG
jgi:hypothetical protein